MATQFNVHKVAALPGTLEAHAIYLVLGAGADTFIDAYITDASGNAKNWSNTTRVNELVNAAIGQLSTIQIVADITARDALGLTENAFVLVLDASGDPTVAGGNALYAWEFATTTWHKLAEFESLDVVIDWTDVQNRPTSAVADIDDAVAKRHDPHTNRAQIDKIGEDANAAPTYDGDQLTYWGTLNW
jgi:hypothetical protein